MKLSAPPSPLKSLQQELYALLTDPRGARAASAARPETAALIKDAPPLDRPTRLSVYGDGYFLRLFEALTEDFKGVRRVVGETKFRDLCAEFIASHPSTSPSLADLGEVFPDFIAAREPRAADLAALERAVVRALLGPREAPLDPAELSAVAEEDWARARLRFDPSVRLLDLPRGVVRLWRSREEKGVRPPSPKPAVRSTVLLHRDEIWVRVREAEKGEASLLRRALSGETLEKLFAEDSAARPDEITRWFGAWMSAGLIVSVAIGKR